MIALHSGPNGTRTLALDTELARSYHEAMRALQKELNAPGEITISTILQAPGVMRFPEQALEPEEAWPAIDRALRGALADLIKMREREGKHLAKDLIHRLKAIRKKLKEIRTFHPDVVKRYRAVLLDRIQKAGLPIMSDDERLLKEISFFADRADVSEELVRLESHLTQFAVWKVISPNSHTICAAKNRWGAHWNSSPRKCFGNSTRSAQRQTMRQFLSASSPVSRSWRRFASKPKILSKKFSSRGILFVVSAPSGAGKTTLVERIRRTPNLFYSVSCTTRTPRAGEIDRQDYRFLSDADFRERVAKGDFVEHAQVHGDHYGTLREPIVTNLETGKDVLIDIDTQGAAVIRNCGDPLIQDALADVFIMPPDLEELRKRLLKRGTETAQQIDSRLATAAREMEHWRDYRYTIISGSVEEDLQRFRQIMAAESYLSRRLIEK